MRVFHLHAGASALILSALFGGGHAQAQTAFSGTVVAPSSHLTVTGPSAGMGQGTVVTPSSSVAQPGDLGVRAHTHYKILVPEGQSAAMPNGGGGVRPAVGGPPIAGDYYNTPASLACVYGLAPTTTAGCNPETLTASSNATGGSRAIALVDAYDNPSAATDLQNYSTQFGLPAINSSNFQVVYASGSQPANNTGWALEEALDIEMAHAMAPNAKIYLVEAASSSFNDLNVAVDKAYGLVLAAGGGEISMSYGGSEFSGESSYDSHFPTSNHVTFFASTGDDPGTQYPSVSPNVVAVGGTSIRRRNDYRVAGQYGFLINEGAWIEGGGGVSAYEPAPSYQQNALPGRLGSPPMRVVPDVAAVADTRTPVWVTCGTGCGNSSSGIWWYHVGGTSVASPLVAAISNNSGIFYKPLTELASIYSQFGSSKFFDVTLGTCGIYTGYAASAYSSSSPVSQWDFCTGMGSPRGRGGI